MIFDRSYGGSTLKRFIRNPLVLCLGISVFFNACKNLDNVTPAARSSFVYYYGGMGNYRAASVLALSDGYLMVGDSITALQRSIVLIRTNPEGVTRWRKKIDNASANSAIVTATGYLVIGDSIYIDLSQRLVINQTRRKMRLISLNSNGSVITDASWGDTTIIPSQNRVDRRGSAVGIDLSGNIISTSTINYLLSSPSIPQYTSLASHNPATLKMNWSVQYNNLNNQDYQNSISLQINPAGDVIWATSAVFATANTAAAFVMMPVMPPSNANATFVNAGRFGQDTSGVYYSGNDIKQAGPNYGIIGTYQTYTGSDANIFFIRTDLQGNPIPGSAIYFDGVSIAKSKKPTNKNLSRVQDSGLALTGTTDGGFLLAGYTTSTNDGTWGNGGKDLFLIRIDPFGNLLWYKTWGGTGDEVPSTVQQTSDGGFLISGTLTLAGQSSMFLLKTDSNGELKN
ncbi:MAG: hypothetical protein JSS93_09060 [Bacteroidetes bacterium]|nr:hypothetical protein [Bacteroidota bacterium]